MKPVSRSQQRIPNHHTDKLPFVRDISLWTVLTKVVCFSDWAFKDETDLRGKIDSQIRLNILDIVDFFGDITTFTIPTASISTIYEPLSAQNNCGLTVRLVLRLVIPSRTLPALEIGNGHPPVSYSCPIHIHSKPCHVHSIPFTSPPLYLLIPAIPELHAYFLHFLSEIKHALPSMVDAENIEADMVMAEASRDPPAQGQQFDSSITLTRPGLGEDLDTALADSSSTAEIAANAPRYRRKSSTFIDAIHDIAEDQGDMAPAQLYSTMSGRLFHSGRIAIVMVGLPARGKT